MSERVLIIIFYFYPMITMAYFIVCIESNWSVKDAIVRAIAWPLILIKNIISHLKG